MENNDSQSKQSGLLPFGQNQIYYETQGAGKPLVFLHGGGVDHRMWAEQFSHFKDRYQVVVYDIRGHGQSSFQENEALEIEDLKALLDHLKLSDIQLVGLSLGAILAVDFALAYPELVDRLSLLSPGLIGVQEGDSTYLAPLLKMGGFFQKGDIEGAADVVEDITFLGQRDRIPEGLDSMRQYVRQSFIEHVNKKNHVRLPQIKEVKPAGRLAEITCPLLLMYGAEDAAYVVRNVERFKKAIPSAEVQVVEGAAHLVNLEKPSEVNARLEKFLEATE